MINQVNVQKKLQSALVLANAGELVVGVIREIAGNDIATSINGASISNEMIASLAYQRISNRLSAQAKAI